MRIEQLEYLIDISNTKSITKTAENFFISRQVVSSNIRTLEEELGRQLLIRNQNSIELTLYGELAVKKAEHVILAYRDFIDAVSNSQNVLPTEETESITIFSIPRLSSTLIPSTLAQFRNIHPNITVRIITQPSSEVLTSIAESTNSIGLISYPDHDNNMLSFQPVHFPQLTITPFITSQFYLLAHKSSSFSKKSSYTPEDLTNLPIISYTPANDFFAGEHDNKLNIQSAVSDLPTLQSLVKQNLGVGLITIREFNLVGNKNEFVLIPISNKSSSLYFAHVLNEQSLGNKYIQAFISLLLQHKW